jgi:hypothetical protein
VIRLLLDQGLPRSTVELLRADERSHDPQSHLASGRLHCFRSAVTANARSLDCFHLNFLPCGPPKRISAIGPAGGLTL